MERHRQLEEAIQEGNHSESNLKESEEAVDTSFIIDDLFIDDMTFRPSSKSRKSVKFSSDTAPPNETILACSITDHEYVPKSRCMQYTINFWRGGQLWKVARRYKEFETFYRCLKREICLLNVNESEIPNLPQKRWFEKQRWINRFPQQNV